MTIRSMPPPPSIRHPGAPWEGTLRDGLLHSETIQIRKPHVDFRTVVRAREKRETADEGRYFGILTLSRRQYCERAPM